MTAFLFGTWLAQGGPVMAQPRSISDTECQSLRQRLSDHAQLSDGVRRSVGAQAAASGSSVATAPTPGLAAGRGVDHSAS
jgi:hypothetical protein